MANIYYDVRVDIQKDNVIDSGLRFTQGDKGVIFLRIQVMDGKNKFYAKNTTPSINFVKSDGTYVVGTPVESGDFWVYQFLGNELQSIGKVLCDVKFEYESGRISSSKFTFIVEKDTTISDAIASNTYITPMEKALDKMKGLNDEGVSLVTAAQSWAVGGTYTREGEDTDNAKYYYEHVKAISDVEIATTEKAGLVKPDDETIKITPEGEISAEPPEWLEVKNKPYDGISDDFAIKRSMVGNELALSLTLKNKIISSNEYVDEFKEYMNLESWKSNYEYPVGAYMLWHQEWIPGSKDKLYRCLRSGNINMSPGLDPVDGVPYWEEVTLSGDISQLFREAGIDGKSTATVLRDCGNGKITDVDIYGISAKCKNLLNSTLESKTLYGLTITNNGDGTYTFNGTPTLDLDVEFATGLSIGDVAHKKLVGCPPDLNEPMVIFELNALNYSGKELLSDVGQGGYYKEYDEWNIYKVVAHIQSYTRFDNVVLKPMIVDTRYYPDATYDDFVQYGEYEINDAILETKNKNLLKLDESKITVADGITYSIENDGSIIINGLMEHSGEVLCFFNENDTNVWAALRGENDLIVTFTEEDISGKPYSLQWYDFVNKYINYDKNKKELRIPHIRRVYEYKLSIQTNVDNYEFDNVRFYPMIRYADIEDDTFVKYESSTVNISKILNSTFIANENAADEVVVNEDGTGTFIKAFEVNESGIPIKLDTPIVTELTPLQISELLLLKTYANYTEVFYRYSENIQDTGLFPYTYKLGYFKNVSSARHISKLNDKSIELSNQITAEDGAKFRFATDGEGNYGYLGADDSFIPFSNAMLICATYGNALNKTSFGTPSSESANAYYNDLVVEHTGTAAMTMKKKGTVKVIYTASGYSTSGSTAYGAYSEILLNGVVVGASTGNQVRIGGAVATFEVEVGDVVRIYTRGSTTQSGGYTATFFFMNKE